jgi:small subunit ribosomal protein S8e
VTVYAYVFIRIRLVRAMGGNIKHRALRLETGNFSWASQSITRKTRVMDVVYNASNNELVRTKTLVKNAIVLIDATPLRQWYEQYYGIDLSKSTKKGDHVVAGVPAEAEANKSKSVVKKHAKRNDAPVVELDPKVAEQFAQGRLYACISSRPGQSGRADGYILEGKELDFYLRKLIKKKGK